MALNVTVTLAGMPEPITVEVINPDRVRWDLTRQKHKWPNFQDAPFLGTTFLAWAAMKRGGHYTDTFEAFRDRDALDVESHDDTDDTDDADDGVGDLGDPTQ